MDNNNEFKNQCKNTKESQSEDTIEKINTLSCNERLLINSSFLDYNKRYATNKAIWWPANVSYGWKKYYVSSHCSYINNPKKTKLYYNCVNHWLNTPLKKMIFGKKNYPGKLEYNRSSNEFYFIHENNEICDKKDKKFMTI